MPFRLFFIFNFLIDYAPIDWAILGLNVNYRQYMTDVLMGNAAGGQIVRRNRFIRLSAFDKVISCCENFRKSTRLKIFTV